MPIAEDAQFRRRKACQSAERADDVERPPPGSVAVRRSPGRRLRPSRRRPPYRMRPGGSSLAPRAEIWSGAVGSACSRSATRRDARGSCMAEEDRRVKVAAQQLRRLRLRPRVILDRVRRLAELAGMPFVPGFRAARLACRAAPYCRWTSVATRCATSSRALQPQHQFDQFFLVAANHRDSCKS